MAVKTADDRGRGGAYHDAVSNGWGHLRLPFLTENLDDTDTIATGLTRITRVAWEALDATDILALTFAQTGIITVATTGGSGNHNGHVLIWYGA